MVSSVITVLLSFLLTQVRSSVKFGCFNEVCKACGVYYRESGERGEERSGVISYRAFRFNTDEKIWNITIGKELREEGRTWTRNFLGTGLRIKNADLTGAGGGRSCGTLEAELYEPALYGPSDGGAPVIPSPGSGIFCDDGVEDVCGCDTLVNNTAVGSSGSSAMVNSLAGFGPAIVFDTGKRCEPSGQGGGPGGGFGGGPGGGLGSGGGSLLPPGGGQSAGRVCLSVPLAWSLYTPDASTSLRSTAPFFCFSYPAGGIFFLPGLHSSPRKTPPTKFVDNRYGY